MGQTQSLHPALKQTRCRTFAKTVDKDKDARLWALRVVYGVPGALLPATYTERAALEDIAACARGKPLPHRAKIARAASGAKALVRRALTRVHGLAPAQAEAALASGLRYTADHARQDVRRASAGVRPRYVIDLSSDEGKVFDTEEGNSLAQLLRPTSPSGILPFDRPSGRRRSSSSHGRSRSVKK